MSESTTSSARLDQAGESITVERIASEPPENESLWQAIQYAAEAGTAHEVDRDNPIRGFIATDETTGQIGYGATADAALEDLAGRLADTQ